MNAKEKLWSWKARIHDHVFSLGTPGTVYYGM